MASPFRTTIYNKFNLAGPLGDPSSLVVTPRHNAISTAEIKVRPDHPRIAALAAEGARAVIRYNEQVIVTGMIRRIRGAGMGEDMTFEVVGDLRLLWGILGWPRPDQPITSQGIKEDKRTGPAETVAKQFIQANATRLGLPITVAATQGRGATITVAQRMTPLADKLLPAIDQAGIGLTIVQSGAGFVVDAYVPTVQPIPLTEASGVIASWALNREAPSVTRAVVGDDAVGATRGFRLWPTGVTTGETALEALWGDKIETFVDAGGTNVGSEMDALGKSAVDAGGVKAGLELALSETEYFRYGVRMKVGDKVTIAPSPLFSITDILREASMSWTADDGVVINPSVGDQIQITDQSLLVKLTKTLRRLVAR